MGQLTTVRILIFVPPPLENQGSPPSIREAMTSRG
jgi:hypothetical protein